MSCMIVLPGSVGSVSMQKARWRVRLSPLLAIVVALVLYIHLAEANRSNRLAIAEAFAPVVSELIPSLDPPTLAPAAVAANDPLKLAWSSLEANDTTCIVWGDYDNDGDLDLAVGARGQPIRLYRNDQGTLTAGAAWSSATSIQTWSLAWGDYDNDGDLDLAVGAEDRVRLYRNDNGVLTPNAVWTSDETGWAYSLAWGDVDGDSNLELAVGIKSGPYRLYKKYGAEIISIWSSAESQNFTASVAWGDVDGDGDLDLAAGNIGQPNRLYRNNSGTLTLAWSAPITDSTQSVAWGDYDGDGDLDLAVGNYGQPNRLYRNNSGTLTLAWSAPITDSTQSVVWGDYDGDGDLDLAVGNYGQPNRLYRNDGGTLTPGAVWSSAEVDDTRSVAWADYDSDGDLDLAVGNRNQPNRVYRNDSSPLTPNAAWSSTDVLTTTILSLAWGDYDGDGDLDLVVGTDSQNRIYRNNGGTLTTSAVWWSQEADTTISVAWGDVDGDGDLDLAVGNGYNQPNRLYRNNGSTLTPGAVWSSAEADDTRSVAWGDVDGDGDLDLAVGNFSEPNRLYRNEGGLLTLAAVWSSNGPSAALSLAWGDVDGDGDLDLAVGTWGGVKLYRNDRGTLTTNPVWQSAEADITYSVALGDYDGDGDLDLATGNSGQPNRVYRNDGGMLAPSAAWSSNEADDTRSVAWGDYDGDGDLDLAAGNFSQPTRIYRNDHGVLTDSTVWSSVEADITYSVAWGDVDCDGDYDLAAGTAGPARLYRNLRDRLSSAGAVPLVRVTRPGPGADFFSVAKIWSDATIPITYTLSDPQGDPVRSIYAYYSPDGGGHWLPAVAGSGTITANLVTTGTYAYKWNVFASGFFGQSDNVIFRLVAVPAITYRPNKTPGPYWYGSSASETFPFRVRGTQVRVMSGTLPASNALVYRLPAGQAQGAIPFADGTGQPFRTDGQGYLQGRGQLWPGDRLVALLPITSTQSYTLYLTNAAPTSGGLNAFSVTQPGVQTLTVSTANPLLLFSLDASLEWDARQDTAYLNQLEFNLQRASEMLYDITNGQAALGNVKVYHNREQWNDAHIRIYANNQLRPFASQGGLVTTPVTDPITSTLVYFPGQLNMGATWNRYGNTGISMGEDWPRTLAHELGHYLLYLDDDYLGLDAQGWLVPVTTCVGTIMSDPYRDDYSELHGPANWLQECGSTLSNRSTGRSDWQTADTFYPALNITSNTGPSSLPLQVTQVKFVEPVTPTLTLPDSRFYLIGSNGASLLPGNHAQAYLFRNNQLVNLGRPVVDQVLARGVQPGDRVCVFELEASRLGCKAVSVNDNQQMTLYTLSNWQPDVRITPVNSRTVNLQVLNLTSGLSLKARLYDDTGFASSTIALTFSSTGNVYSGTFNLSEPILDASIHIWVNEADPRREIVTYYSVGGNPGNQRSHFGNQRSHFGNQRSHFAPVLSGDGQVILYGANLNFAPGAFYVLQTATLFPNPPPWATVVGKGYWLSRSANAPALVGSSISMSYAQNEVPSGEEPFLRVYFRNGAHWTVLPTTLMADANMATAPAQGPGLYVLMSVLEIPLHGPGWDLLAYPVQGTRPVTQALQSINGYYSTVYWYDWADVADPWKVYDPSVPTWVNDLSVLKFGEAYWISMTQAITLYLKGGQALALDSSTNASQYPPATYYGAVLSGSGFTPTSGMSVTAWIDGKLCGQGKTLQASGQIVYTINVPEGFDSGCGAPGRQVKFKVSTQEMFATAIWDNNRLWQVPLAPVHRVYLPQVLNNQGDFPVDAGP